AQLREFDAARAHAARAIALKPNDPMPHAIVAFVLHETGDLVGAMLALFRALLLEAATSETSEWAKQALEVMYGQWGTTGLEGKLGELARAVHPNQRHETSVPALQTHLRGIVDAVTTTPPSDPWVTCEYVAFLVAAQHHGLLDALAFILDDRL